MKAEQRIAQLLRAVRYAPALAGYLSHQIRETARLYARHTAVQGMVRFEPQSPNGRVLVSYKRGAFDMKKLEATDHAYYHANVGRTRQIVATFLALGLGVDVVDEKNDSFVPKKDYSVLVATRFDAERLSSLIDSRATRIVHLETSDTHFHNGAEQTRLFALQQRRKISLSAKRYMAPNHALEIAHAVTLTGNEFTRSTYEWHSGTPIYTMPSAPPVRFDAPVRKNFAACRNRFLWVGSHGLVHKGLDLVLEAFASMPEMELVVCGPVHEEEDFNRAFAHELYNTPNISVAGWTDLRSARFKAIVATCVASVNASCSEGQCGGVVAAMHAGLIPIASRESGVDLDGFGCLLETSSIEEIRQAVRHYANLDENRLQLEANLTWERARSYHSPESFAAIYRNAIDGILSPRSHCEDAAESVVRSRA